MSLHTPEQDCINWDGAIDQDGYGRIQLAEKWRLAHRVAWETKNGPIPKPMVIDHLCRNRKCVNTDHMELVTNRENVLRGVGPTAINASKNLCSNGHEFEISKNGKRWCRICARKRWKEYRARKILEGTWKR